jgi:hypothetical protein
MKTAEQIQSELTNSLKALTPSPEYIEKALRDYVEWFAKNSETHHHDDAIASLENVADAFYSQAMMEA